MEDSTEDDSIQDITDDHTADIIEEDLMEAVSPGPDEEDIVTLDDD